MIKLINKHNKLEGILLKTRFTLIELLVVIAMMAILLSSKCSFFLLFSAI